MNRVDAMVPTTINGVRLPNLVLVRSDSIPKTGSKNNAITLSNAIIIPVTVSPIPNVFFKISGIIFSYNCQKELIDKKARPTKNVRL